MSDFTISEAAMVLFEKFDGALSHGGHTSTAGCACVQELRSVLLGLPFSDAPEGNTPVERATRALNDAPWASDDERTFYCLPLVTLSESHAVPGWQQRCAEGVARLLIPLHLRLLGLPEAAAMYEQDGDLQAAMPRWPGSVLTLKGSASGIYAFADSSSCHSRAQATAVLAVGVQMLLAVLAGPWDTPAVRKAVEVALSA
jgi:hypothetical protein